MKGLFVTIFLLSLHQVIAQNYFNYIRANAKSYGVSGGLSFIAGASDGFTQTLQFHYWEFEKKFPKAKGQYWNPAISWKNKYKDVDNGNYDAKFFGSKTFLCWVTDGYHLTRTITNTSMLAACVVDFDRAKKWHWYIHDFVILSLIKSVGFHLTYSIIFDT